MCENPKFIWKKRKKTKSNVQIIHLENSTLKLWVKLQKHGEVFGIDNLLGLLFLTNNLPTIKCMKNRIVLTNKSAVCRALWRQDSARISGLFLKFFFLMCPENVVSWLSKYTKWPGTSICEFSFLMAQVCSKVTMPKFIELELWKSGSGSGEDFTQRFGAPIVNKRSWWKINGQ